MAVLRNCVCCGKSYEFCPGCHRKDQPAWMATFCSEPCKELFNMVSAYNVKRIDKAALSKYMTEHNVDSSKYVGSVRKALEEAKELAVANITPIKNDKEEKKVAEKATKVVKKASSPNIDNDANSEFRSRRNKRRRNRPMDIDLN